MKTEIQAIHFKADQKLVDHIEKKLQKLATYYDGIIDAKVFLRLDNSSSRENKQIEIKIHVQNQTIFKTQTGHSFESATDLCVDALKTQIKRYKEKLSGVL